MDQAKLCYTVEEAANLLSISRAQVYRLIDKAELGSVAVGRSRRITHAQLLNFLTGLEAKDNSSLPTWQAIRMKRQHEQR
ncbi:MAG: helix-turn-helix domain-containing protein [Fimbriimonadaceae bacterium]|nr:helix-turn-helix domain-containing protein [Fimbriimonadaceae bacterium]